VNDSRSFSLRILKSGWGIAIDIVAQASVSPASTSGAIQASPRIWLRILPPLPTDDSNWLLFGLRRVASQIEEAYPHDPIMVEIEQIDYVPTDYQPEAMAAAIIGWATEEFDLGDPDIDVTFDRGTNRYVFSY
jgi:hypothetical protein